jgi:hypothetical protein
MTEEKDHLSNDVAISGSLTIRGVELGSLSLGTKSRAVASLDRLIGSSVDMGSAFFEGVARRRRAKDAVELELINAEGKAAIAIAYGDPDFGERVANRFLKDQARRQINREAVAASAIEHLQESGEPGVEDVSIDDHWFSIFESEAEKATTDRLRDLWGRVLAGEIRKPGSFSLATVRFISELDSAIASTFQKYLSNRFTDGKIIKPKELKGQVLEDLTFLEACGLMQGVHGHIHMTLTPNEEGYIDLHTQDLVLRIMSKNTVTLRFIYLTKIGREISTILPKVDEIEALNAVAQYFYDKAAELIIFRKGEKLTDNKISLYPLKVIKKNASNLKDKMPD